PSLRARIAICGSDSSPETYRTGARAATASAICMSRVDLPTPGSPPTSTTEPGTMPPPRTRSHSDIGVCSRATCSARTSSSRETRSADGRALPREAFGRSRASSREFQVPQLGHCPSQRGWRAPQAEHRYVVLDFVMASAQGQRADWNQSARCPRCFAPLCGLDERLGRAGGHHQLAILNVDVDGLSASEPSLEHPLRDGVLDVILDRPPQRTCAKRR